MKYSIALLSISLSLFLGLFVLVKKQSQSRPSLTIGIIQTASHPALDAARDGFIEMLQEHLEKPVTFIIKNAQGSVSNAQLIAHSFHNNDDIQGVLAIGTLAAQSMAQIEKEKPLFIAAVTDRVRSGLMHDNICGSTDMVDAVKAVDMIRYVTPKVQKIAVMLNVGEINSVIAADTLDQELTRQGLTAIRIGFATEAEIPAATAKACSLADAIIIPPDNTLATTITLVARIAQEHKKPLFVTFPVAQGALATRGVNYFDSGRQAAQCAIEVLINGKKPHDIPLKNAQAGAITINKKVAEALDVSIPHNVELIEIIE